MARLFNEMLAAVVAGETISDEEIKGAAYAVENYEITTGDMSQTWHTCRPEELGAYIDAHKAPRARLKDLEGPAPVADPEIAALIDAIMAAEEHVQNYEDNEQYAKASKARAKVRELKAQLAARRTKGA